ncbi:MAG: hypothetical protein NTV01_17510 [Bacteroidia bacterium]|nr:hypothetical protein [Bacteroidia bacterium]
MKKLVYILSISALTIFTLVVLLPSCEGPTGPAGKDGKDVNAFCAKCHNDANFASVEAQFATSKHGEGETWAGDGNRQTCARCHSYQGFKETMLTGRDTVEFIPKIPVALQCDACHDFHGTLDSTDFPNYALGHTGPVRVIMDPKAAPIDFGNSSNACVYCHQARPGAAIPVATTGDTTYAITSSRYGPHHGPQGNILNGTQGWEVAGALPYTSTNHKGVATCSMCHMAVGVGTEMGGHTWRIANADDTKDNLTGCKKCHTDITTLDYKGRQTEIVADLEKLQAKLVTLKLLDPATMLAIPWNQVASGTKLPGKGARWSIKETGAFFNFQMVEADRSEGVHNYKYIKALVNNAYDAIK